MINLNISNKLPKSLYWYTLFRLLITVSVVSLPFIFLGRSSYFGTFYFLILIIVLPFWAYLLISFRVTSFIIEPEKITKNFGIIIKKSNSIALDRVQNVGNIRGPISSLFGLTKVRIWTASPSQIQIEKGKSENKPDITLVIKTTDADWLKNFILEKRKTL